MKTTTRIPAGGRRLLQVGARLVSLALLQSCTTGAIDLDGTDDSAFSYGGKLLIDLGGPGETETEPEAERHSRAPSLELDVSRGTAGGEQRLGGGEAVIFGGKFFSGPARLAIDYELTQIQFNVRMATPSWNSLSIEAAGGLEYSAMDIDVSEIGSVPERRGRSSVHSWGPGVGASLIWQPLNELRLSAGGRVAVGFSSEVDTVDLTTMHAGLTVFPIENLGLFVGWRRVTFEAGPGDRFESGVDLELSGPMLSLWIRL